MIEVKPTAVAVPSPVAVTSAKSVVDSKEGGGVRNSTSVLVEPKLAVSVNDVQASESISSHKMDAAISSMSSYVQSVQRDLQFSVDDGTDKMVVKVTDSETGDLIRQIPGELFLELARKLKEDGEFSLVDATG